MMLRPKMPSVDDQEGSKVPAGLPPVIDAHVHISPSSIFSAIRKWFDEHAWHIRYQMTSSEVFEFLLSRGIRHIVALQYAHKPGIARQLNKYMAEKCREYERMDLIGQLTVQGNLPYLTCAEGNRCKMSGVKVMYGPGAKTADFGYSRVEDQGEVWKEATRIGRLIGVRLETAQKA